MCVGSAPIAEETLDFLKVCFSSPIVEGYGQTEGMGLQLATDSNDRFSNHLGGPFDQNEFKLVDVPEMNYLTNDKNE
jgi:long-chain acyl-CoA synthetase